ELRDRSQVVERRGDSLRARQAWSCKRLRENLQVGGRGEGTREHWRPRRELPAIRNPATRIPLRGAPALSRTGDSNPRRAAECLGAGSIAADASRCWCFPTTRSTALFRSP